MRILILEDEPIIAIDMEDIVIAANGADCTLAATVEEGMLSIDDGVDFAILDVHLGFGGRTSFPVATMLQKRGIPFCFVSCSGMEMPGRYGHVPFVAKPFRPSEISRLLPVAA